MNTLHIYGQRWWHDTATVMGDRESLERLRDAIIVALENGIGECEAMTSDGEGYTVRVMLIPPEADLWPRFALPYRDEMAQGTSRDREWPE